MSEEGSRPPGRPSFVRPSCCRLGPRPYLMLVVALLALVSLPLQGCSSCGPQVPRAPEAPFEAPLRVPNPPTPPEPAEPGGSPERIPETPGTHPSRERPPQWPPDVPPPGAPVPGGLPSMVLMLQGNVAVPVVCYEATSGTFRQGGICLEQVPTEGSVVQLADGTSAPIVGRVQARCLPDIPPLQALELAEPGGPLPSSYTAWSTQGAFSPEFVEPVPSDVPAATSREHELLRVAAADAFPGSEERIEVLQGIDTDTDADGVRERLFLVVLSLADDFESLVGLVALYREEPALQPVVLYAREQRRLRLVGIPDMNGDGRPELVLEALGGGRLALEVLRLQGYSGELLGRCETEAAAQQQGAEPPVLVPAPPPATR